jgi:hypothetical protein
VLVYEKFELTDKLRLLILIGQIGDASAIVEGLALRWPKRGHVLNEKQAHLVTSLIEEVVLDFNLFGRDEVSTIDHEWLTVQLTCFRSMLKPSFFKTCRSYTIASLFGGV